MSERAAGIVNRGGRYAESPFDSGRCGSWCGDAGDDRHVCLCSSRPHRHVSGLMALGYHQTEIDPRDHNFIEKTDFETIKKKSENLDGEIFYYKNIPNQIKDLFPIFVNCDVNNTWYQIEKINAEREKLYLECHRTPGNHNDFEYWFFQICGRQRIGNDSILKYCIFTEYTIVWCTEEIKRRENETTKSSQ